MESTVRRKRSCGTKQQTERKKNGAIARARVTSALFAFESARVEFMERKKQTGLLKGNANRTSAFISCGEKLFGEDPRIVGDF